MSNAESHPSHLAQYRCRKCAAFIPHGHRMQSCECGKVAVDWGAGGHGQWVRVLWPDGDPDDWVEVIAAKEGKPE
jgi:hypothetical protein